MAKATFEQTNITDSLKPLQSGTQSSSDMRNAFASLHQTDLAPLRAVAQGWDTLNVWVNPALVESYFMPVLNVSGVPCTKASGISPTTWVPPSNNRIDVLHVNAAEPNAQYFWVSGSVAASPTIPTISTSGTPICAVYHRSGSTKTLAADAGSHSYLYRDMRPLYSSSVATTAANALAGSVVGTNHTKYQSIVNYTTAIAIPFDSTVPTSSEGDQYMVKTYTPSSSTNTLLVDIGWYGSMAGTGARQLALFVDGSAAAHTTSWGTRGSIDTHAMLLHTSVTGFAASGVTFKVRAGTESTSQNTMNGLTGAAIHTAVQGSFIRIQEVKS